MLHRKMTIIGGLFALLLFTAICTAGEPEFKVAVAADSKEKSGQISMVAGRAPYFLIFDKAGKLLETVDNPHTDAKGGVGRSTANFLAKKKVTVVIAGRFGSKMVSALKATNIKYIERQGVAVDEIKGVEHAK